MKNNKPGFTLIELLVVIAIIGLLSTLSIIALNSARARSRDARRISDIKQIQTALEMYYNLADQYPGTISSSTATSAIAYTSGASSTVFLSVWPKAPTPVDGNCTTGDDGNNVYKYTVGTNNSSYILTYCLGDSTGGVPAGPQTATPVSIY